MSNNDTTTCIMVAIVYIYIYIYIYIYNYIYILTNIYFTHNMCIIAMLCNILNTIDVLELLRSRPRSYWLI